MASRPVTPPEGTTSNPVQTLADPASFLCCVTADNSKLTSDEQSFDFQDPGNFQDPKMEVHWCFVGISPYIGFKNRPYIYIYVVGTSNSGSCNGH